MTVPSVVVHRLEGHTSRLYGSLARISQCSVGGQVGQPREVSSSVDGFQEGVIGCVVCSALRDLDGCASLFIHLSLVHHYRVHKRGLPHITFRKNYLLQLRALLPLPVGLPPAGVVSPDSSSSWLLCLGDSPEVLRGPTRTTRRAHRRRRPVCVEEPAVVSVPVFTIQDPLAAAGAMVLDCRPPLLPVSMDISDVNLSAGRFPATSAGMDGLIPGSEQLSKGGGGGACWDKFVRSLVWLHWWTQVRT